MINKNNVKSISERINEIEKEFGKLSPVQKILLSTDGSVTAILDILYGKTEFEVLQQKTVKADKKIAEILKITKDEDVLLRLILMYNGGKSSILARSYMSLNIDNTEFKNGIFSSRETIGNIIKKLNLETRREIIDINIGKGSINDVFKEHRLLLSRTYKIISGGKVLIFIEETISPNVS